MQELCYNSYQTIHLYLGDAEVQVSKPNTLYFT